MTKRASIGGTAAWLCVALAAVVVICITLGAAAPVAAQQPIDGKAVFEKWCAPCHGDGPGKPGTNALQALYKGAKPALLEKRTDLPPELTMLNDLSVFK